MKKFQSFAYRAPRFEAQVPLTFQADGHEIRGVTQNLSSAGVLVQLEAPVLPGTSGRVRLCFGGCLIDLEAQVTHADLLEAGLRFCFGSAAEEQFVAELTKMLAKHTLRAAGAHR